MKRKQLTIGIRRFFILLLILALPILVASLAPEFRSDSSKNPDSFIPSDLFVSPAWAQVSADPAMAGYQSMLGSLGGGSFTGRLVQHTTPFAVVTVGYVHTGALYFGPYHGEAPKALLSGSVPDAWVDGVSVKRGVNDCTTYLEELRFGAEEEDLRNAKQFWRHKTYKDVYESDQDWCADGNGLWMGPLPLPGVGVGMSSYIPEGDQEAFLGGGACSGSDGFYSYEKVHLLYGSVASLNALVMSKAEENAMASYYFPIAGNRQRVFFGVSADPSLYFSHTSGTTGTTNNTMARSYTNIPLGSKFVGGNIGFFPRPGTPYKYLTPGNGTEEYTTGVSEYYANNVKARKGVLWGVSESTISCPDGSDPPGYEYNLGDNSICSGAAEAACEKYKTTYNATSQQLIHLGRNTPFTGQANEAASETDDINQTEIYLFRYHALIDQSDDSTSIGALISSTPAVDLTVAGEALTSVQGPDLLLYSNAGCHYKTDSAHPEIDLMWAAPYSLKLFQNLDCSPGLRCDDDDSSCARPDVENSNLVCRFRSIYDENYFVNLLTDMEEGTDLGFLSRYVYNDYLKARIASGEITRTMTLSEHEPVLALAINRSTGYIGARLWDPDRHYADHHGGEYESKDYNQFYLGPVNVPLFPPEIHLLVKRKPKSIPGGGKDKYYLVASQGVGNTKDRTVGVELNWRIPVVKSFDCKQDDSQCRLSPTDQETVSRKLAAYFRKPKDDGKNELRINPYRVSFHHRRELTAAVDVNGNVQHAEGTFSSGEIRPGWQTVALNIPVDDSGFPVSTLSVRVNPWTTDKTSDDDVEVFLAGYHQVAGGQITETDGDTDTDPQPWEKRLEGWYKKDDPTWTSFGQATCLTQREYDEYKIRFTTEAGTDLDDYSMRWVEKFESNVSEPDDGLIDKPIVIEERGHLCWIKPCKDLLRPGTVIENTCFGEEAAKEDDPDYIDKDETTSMIMCKVCYTRESTLDIVSVEASSDPDGDEDNNVGIWAKEDGDTDADPERGSNMLTAGQSEGFLGGDPQSLEIGLGAFIESHFATDDITSPESGVHLYALQIYMPQSSGEAQSVYRLCIAVGGGTERLDCGISCSAVPESDRELIGGHCMDPGDWSVVPETFDFDLFTANWDWSKMEDYADVRLFEVGFWFSPLWEYRLWNPVQFWCYGEDYRAKKYRIVPREATVPDDPALKEWVHCFAEILDEEVSSVVVTAQDNAGKGRVAFADANVVDPWYEDPSLLSSVTLNNQNNPPSFFLLGTRKSEEELDANVVVTGASASKNYEREFGITVFWVEHPDIDSDNLRFRNAEGEVTDWENRVGSKPLGLTTSERDRIGIRCEISGKAKMYPDFFASQGISVHADVVKAMFTQDIELRNYADEQGGTTIDEVIIWSQNNDNGNDHPIPDARDDELPKLFMVDPPGIATTNTVQKWPIGTIARTRMNSKSWVMFCLGDSCREPQQNNGGEFNEIFPFESNWMRVSNDLEWYNRMSAMKMCEVEDYTCWQLLYDVGDDNCQGLGQTSLSWY